MGATTRESRPSLDALTGVRILAAMHVVVFHFGTRAAASTGVAPIETFTRMGFIGVSLFFVLSGFVLAYSYAGGDGALAGTRRAFWIARLARIYPLFVVAMLLGGVGYAAHLVAQHGLARGLVRAAITAPPVLLLLQAWTPLTLMAWNGPGWSLSAEAFFYLVFPSIVGRVRCDTRARLLALGAACFLAANALPVALHVASLHTDLGALTVRLMGTEMRGGELLERVVGFNPLVRLPEFVFGVGLGKYFLAERSRGERSSGALLAAGAGLALVILFAASPALPRARYLVQNGLFLPLFGALVLGLARGGGRLGRALSARPMTRLGEASYAVYILQDPLYWLFAYAAFGRPEDRAPSAGWLACFVIALVVASFAAHRYIELPGRELVKRRSHRASLIA